MQDLGKTNGERHFTGLAARLLFDFLDRALGSDATAAVVASAGQRRSRSEMSIDTSWLSYTEFRGLLETAAEMLGGPERLLGVGDRTASMLDSTATTNDHVHALGSPDVVYAKLENTQHLVWTIIDVSAEEVGEREWRATWTLHAGFEPYPALCFFVDGLNRLVPTVFGYPPADSIHEQCRSTGDAMCVSRFRWFPADDSKAQARHAERRVQMLEGRLRVLQETVHELVSGADLDELLGRIIGSAAKAVNAPGYILALSPPDGRVDALNVDPIEAERIAERALTGQLGADSRYLAADVVSPRRNYGTLIAVNTEAGRFLDSERVVLGVYASLVAAALDSAAALDEAHRQTNSAHTLLDLSISLAELTSTDETAERVIRAVRVLVDCDQAALMITDPETGDLKIAAHSGLPAEAARLTAGFAVPVDESVTREFSFFDQTTAHHPRVDELMAASGLVAVATTPIVANSELIGMISVGVTHHPERLDVDTLEERLRGLAAQAASAITNNRLVDHIRHQGLHDSLTGLANRALILNRAEHLLARARRDHLQAAALFIDLDNFKAINDTFGHPAGDQLLKAVASRVSGALRECDTVGRLGGDEFVVLSEGSSLAAGPELIAERISDVLREPFELPAVGETLLTVSASIGIASGDRASAEDLLRDADIALYRAKSAGKNCYALFEEDMQSEVIKRLELEMELRGALEADRFSLVYQPVLDLDDMSVSGFEALLRWERPGHGTVPPDEFIPILEETGLIVDVGSWVLTEACRTAAGWEAQGLPASISVNVSVRQLEAKVLVGHVQLALDQSGLTPENLLLEVTETALMRDTKRVLACLTELKDLGVRLAIDDFGTGYCSLAYLRQFPIDLLKIDRTFIEAMADSTEATALTQALVKLGHTLGLRTVAEGVEQPDQLASLRRHRCESGQGYLFARPMPAHEVPEYLKTAAVRADTPVP